MSGRLRIADQIVPTLAFGDAISNDALELQRLFWTRGVQSEIFVDEAKPEMLAFARSWRDLRPERATGGPLLIHMSMGNDAIDEVVKLRTGAHSFWLDPSHVRPIPLSSSASTSRSKASSTGTSARSSRARSASRRR